MKVKRGLLLLLLVVCAVPTVAQAQLSRVVFFNTASPFTTKVKITDAQEGQYARPHTIYGSKYILIGKLKPSTSVVYDYLAPTPAFYVGKHPREQLTPTEHVQFVGVKRLPIFGKRVHFRTYSGQEFKARYDHNKKLRRQLLKSGYRSVEEVMSVQVPATQTDKN